MNREHVYKTGFIIGTVLLAGFVSWMTNSEFGLVWYAIAVVTTDLAFVLKEIQRRRLS
jgi:hypothetical protein